METFSNDYINNLKRVDKGQMGWGWSDFLTGAANIADKAGEVAKDLIGPVGPTNGGAITTLPTTLPNTPTPPVSTTDTLKKFILPVAVIGGGFLLLSKKKSKHKSLSGMKLGIKNIGKNILPELEHIALVAGGMVASQKFLDLDKILANRDPNGQILNMVVAHQGGVKLVLGLGVAAMSKNPMVKCIAYGVAIGGLIKEVRTLTGSDASWIPQIGAENSLMQNAANSVLGGDINQLDQRSSSSVLGMDVPTTTTVGCADYGNGMSYR